MKRLRRILKAEQLLAADQAPEQAASSDVPRFKSRRAHHFPYKSLRYVIEAGGSESLGAFHGGASRFRWPSGQTSTDVTG